MTKTFLVDSNNDLYLDSNGNIAIGSNLIAVLQTCEHVAKTRLGEEVLVITDGIPYFETVWNGSPNLIQFEAAMRFALLQVPDVTEIVSLNTVIVDDVLQYEAVIRTIYGQGTING